MGPSSGKGLRLTSPEGALGRTAGVCSGTEGGGLKHSRAEGGLRLTRSPMLPGPLSPCPRAIFPRNTPRSLPKATAQRAMSITGTREEQTTSLINQRARDRSRLQYGARGREPSPLSVTQLPARRTPAARSARAAPPAPASSASPPVPTSGRPSERRRAGLGPRGEAAAGPRWAPARAAAPPGLSAGGLGGTKPEPPAGRTPARRPPRGGRCGARAAPRPDGPPNPRRGLTSAGSNSSRSSGQGGSSGSRLMVAESAPRRSHGRSARRRLPRRHGRTARPAPPGVPPLRRPPRRRRRRRSLPLALRGWGRGREPPPPPGGSPARGGLWGRAGRPAAGRAASPRPKRPLLPASDTPPGRPLRKLRGPRHRWAPSLG